MARARTSAAGGVPTHCRHTCRAWKLWYAAAIASSGDAVTTTAACLTAGSWHSGMTVIA